jgi:hypothetical protein
VDFFHTTREYRNEVEMTLKNARIAGQANATLQGKTQDQASQSGHSPGQSGHNHGSGHCPGHGDEKFKGRKCVCGEMHLFKECPYIVTSARKSGWTENPTVREEIRQKIKKNPRYLTAIRQIIDTNILDGLNDQKDQKDQTTEDDVHFHFSGVTTVSQKVAIMTTKNPLSNSVIYDSGCSQPLTYDKARFVGEITPASDWIDTPNGPMLAEGYGTMRVDGKLGDKAIRMDFAKTAWVSTTSNLTPCQSKRRSPSKEMTRPPKHHILVRLWPRGVEMRCQCKRIAKKMIRCKQISKRCQWISKTKFQAMPRWTRWTRWTAILIG